MVSLRRRLRAPCATASRCRSWLPSRQRADAPKPISRRSTPRESGPRLTRSPSTKSVSRLGEKPIFVEQAAQGGIAALHIADTVK